MTNLATLFPSVTVRDVYTPGTWKFTGAERWYDTVYTGAGNQITLVARFKRATFAGATAQEGIVRGFGNNYSQGALFCYSTTFTTTTRQGCFRFLVQSTTGTILCDLFTEPDIWMDDEWHTIVASYDGTAGTAVMYIDGVAAIDATNAEHTLTTGTPRGGSNDFVVGDAITTSFYPYAGHIGYIGFCETYVTDWTLFMEPDGSPKKIDEVNWTEFNGVQPLYWSEHGELIKGNKGSGGELVRSANCVLSDAPVTRSGILTYPNSISTEEYAIVNPSAEDGDYTTGWTLNACTWGRSAVQATPHEGTYIWYIGNALSGHIYQDILAVSNGVTRGKIDGGGVLLLAGYHGASYNGQDNSRMQVDFYDGTPGSLISSLDTGYLAPWGNSSGTPIWQPMVVQGIIPVGTVTLRLNLLNYRRNGTACNGYMDSVFMRAHY